FRSVISRLQQCTSRRPLATSNKDDHYIVNNAPRNWMMNATQLKAHLREVRGTQVSRQTIRNRLHQVPDHTTRHRHHRLAWAREHFRWTRDQWASVLFSDEIRFTLSGNYGRQQCLRRQGERYAPAPVLTRQAFGGWRCFSLGMSTRYRIIRESLLETGVAQMEWLALSPDLSPLENLWDQLSRRVEARNTPPTSRDAIPQQTISRFVNSMRRRRQAVIDAQRHMTSY
uniref:Transposase Tc1-like domain-containing protein n=1 Tax=Hippocampus comes TaxID=109280 RepID=A0A3Q2YAR5_HIPCM